MKIDPFNRFLYNEFEETPGGGGTGVFESSEPAPNETSEGTPGSPNAPPTNQPAPGFDPNAITRAIQEGFARNKPTNAPAQPQMTEAERKKALKVWEPDEAFAQEFRAALAGEHGSGGLRKAIGKLAAGLMEQASTFAELRTRYERQQLDAEYGPLREHISETKKKQAREAFFKEYPDLEPFAQLMPAVVQQLGPEAATLTGAALNKAVADAAVKLIQGVRPDFKLSQAQTPGGQTQRPASVSGGGQPGGSSSVASTGKSKSSSIWD